ncbi:MAG TPA: hypothetical protein QGF08_05235 [Candidatus Marinimicrobia bacterium]|jgi:hypothetical protein|nr:hypothetical protein [Candidatus Neomarinimicrobiota bacterium]MDP7217628.1 hypothetical protein [Candidatus Neomarinimicrobiota bacterium]MDP7436526.1 hypothetical protein [Candidatus Neomarinimicrobiota bacterium]HBN45987.1 hypothetical protein [Candidatus Neomarinimicrobiota bacterium]HJL74126.1 hypothetical protein [Candidatus Neomarinimicrobiota bacterium]|tara:strand:+ start:4045 stop:4548 length:504 start_codon:yes stop_codon:yes gene_type:complete
MFKRFIVFFVLTVCLFGQQQNRLFWDGGDWKRVKQLAGGDLEMEYRIKAAYVNGVLDGRLFFYLKTWSVEQGLADSLYAETIDYLSPRELVRSLDNFYADPLMVYVPVPSAMIIANMYAERIPLKIIDAYVQQTKFWINDLHLRMDEHSPAELLEEKHQKHLDKQPE